MKIVINLLMLVITFSGWSQETYNQCSSAFELCPNQLATLTNIDANKTVCSGCEDDFVFCFTSTNTIWLKFTTNAVGGDVQIDFSNLSFESSTGQDTEMNASILIATVPCNSASYTPIGNCVTNAIGPFSLAASSLAPSTTYYVVIEGDNLGAGITSAAEFTVDVLISGPGIDRPVSSVDITSSSLTICKNEIYTATANLTNCPDNGIFTWFINGVQTATTTDPTFQSTSLNDGDVVSVQTSCYSLCTEVVNDLESVVTVYSFPINAGEDIQIAEGETVQLSGTTTSTDFAWSPPLNISDTNSLTPYVFPDQTTVYTLTATDGGCTLSDQVIITVAEELIIPTTFSPNDDGTNDKWEITGIHKYPNCFVRIYNRWGQEVFQSVGYSASKAWDGKDGNAKLSEGVYFYIVELRDEDSRKYDGTITLIR